MINPSIAPLLARLDAAAAGSDVDVICAAVKRALIEQIGSGEARLPDEFRATAPDGYARRLLHKTDDYAAVVMVWAPGQGTPIHDHDDKWCVECVYDGRIRVHSFDLIGDSKDEVVGFREAGQVEARRGMAGSLIPPFDYHVIENSFDETAITIHIYGGEMHACHTYEAVGDGQYQRHRRELSYTP